MYYILSLFLQLSFILPKAGWTPRYLYLVASYLIARYFIAQQSSTCLTLE